MSIKVVILFQDITAVGVTGGSPFLNYSVRSHIAGWSESIYWFGDDVVALTTALTQATNGNPGLLPARAALLPASAAIIGVRLYQGGAGRGQSLGLSYPGAAGNQTDVPQMALLCKLGNASAAVARRFTIRGIPDVFVTAGEWIPTIAYANLVGDYIRALQNFVFRAIDPASPVAPIFAINTAGLVQLNQNTSPFVNGQFVTIQKALDVNQIPRSLKTTITAIGPNANQFTLAAWPFGPCTGGKATAKTFGLWGITASLSGVVRAVVRKVGRPFEQYRGRRSKKRRVA